MSSRNLVTILVLVLVAVAGAFIYHKMNEPRPLEERIDAAVQELGDGNLGDAADEINDRTPLDQVKSTVEEAGEDISATIHQ